MILCFSCLVVSQLFSQHPHPTFRNYTTEDGLPSSEVHIALQDKDGFMWFGTDNGLSRFDGYRFKNYGSREGLKNPVVFDLKEDEEGRLWILTMSGNIYIHENDSIFPYEFNHVITQYKDDYYMCSTFSHL